MFTRSVIWGTLWYAASIHSTGANSILSRKRLVDLLSNVNGASVLLSGDFVSLIESGSFLERTVSGGGGGGGSGGGGGGSAVQENRRRVNAHEPCECPDLSDTEADPCLTKRLNLVHSSMQVLSGELSQLSSSMRVSFNSVSTKLDDIGKRITKSYEILYKGHDGQSTIQSSVAQQVLLIRGIAQGLAKCLNAYWGQSFMAYELTQRDLTHLDDKIRDIFRQISLYLSQIQQSQDNVNYSNTILATEILNAELAAKTKEVNVLSESVYVMLTKLSANMELNEDGTSKLASSLQSAAELLSSKVEEYPTVIGSYLDKATQNVAAFALKTSNSFNADATQLLTLFTKKATQKLRQLSSSTAKAVADDRTDFVSPMRSVEAGSKTDPVVAARDAFLAYSQGQIYNEAQKVIDGLVATSTNTIDVFLSKNKAQLDSFSVSAASIGSMYGSIGPDSSQKKALAQSLVTQRGAAASAAIDELLGALPLKGHDTLTSAAALALQVVDSVGKSTQHGQNTMFGQMTAMGDSLSQKDAEASKVSGKTMAAGKVLLTRSLSAVDGVSTNLDGTMRNQFTNALSDFGQLVVLKRPALFRDKDSRGEARQAALLGSERVVKLSQKLMMSGDASVQKFLDSLSKQYSNGTLNIHQVRAQLREQLAKQDFQSTNGDRVEKDARRATAAGADAVASFQDSLGDQLSQLAARVQPALSQAAENQISPTDVSATTAQLEETKNRLDANRVVGAEFGPAKHSIHSSGSEIVAIGSSRKQDMADSVAHAKRVVLLSADPGRTLHLVQEFITKTNREKTRFDSQLGHAASDDLVSIRSAAKSTDDLVGTALQFITGNNVTLQAEKSSLPGTSNKLSSVSSEATFSGLADSFGEARDFWKLGSQLVATNLTIAQRSALERLATIWALFNVSSNPIPEQTGKIVADMLTKFGNGEYRIGADMDASVHAAASTQAVATKALVSTEELQNVQARMAEIMQTTDIIATSQVSTETNSEQAAALLRSAMKSASGAEGVAGNAAGSANAVANEAQNLLQGAIRDLNTSLSHAGAVDGLQTSVHMSELEKQEAMNRKIAQETSTLIADYEEQLKLHRSMASNNPAMVYSAIAKNKANVENAMGRLLSSAVALNGETLANATSATASSAAMTKFFVATIQKAFKIYAGVDNTTEKLTNVQNFVDVAIQSIIGAEVVRKRNELEATLNDTRQLLVGEIYDLRQSLMDESERHEYLDLIDAETRTDVSQWKSAMIESANTVREMVANKKLTFDEPANMINDQINRTIGNLIDTIESSFKGSPMLNVDRINQLESVRARFAISA